MGRKPPKDRPADWPASSQSWLAKPLCLTLMHLFASYHVIGHKQWPDPPFIIVSNHLSYWDIPAIIPPTPFGTVGLAARKYRDTWKEPFFELFPLIWVTQFSADRQALRDALTVLKGGAILALAPEGTRSRTGSGMIPGTDGAAYIATRADVPIVPCALWGTEKIFKQVRPRVTLSIGRPFRLPAGRAKGDDLAVHTEQIMCSIAALLPEQYHGVYANNPRIAELRPLVT